MGQSLAEMKSELEALKEDTIKRANADTKAMEVSKT
jgi:hypothetical protein